MADALAMIATHRHPGLDPEVQQTSVVVASCTLDAGSSLS
jgi:hypothetical protein